MTSNDKSIHGATITLGIPHKIADLILFADDIVQKPTNDPDLPAPTPTVAVLAAAMNDLGSAETTALSRAKARERRGDHRERGPDRAQDRRARQAAVRGEARGRTVQFRYLTVTPESGKGGLEPGDGAAREVGRA